MNKKSPNNATNNPCFLVFSDDWGEHPSSCQHIFKHIARDHKVLWVNTIGMRNPKFSIGDLKKILYKVRKMLFHSHNTGKQQNSTSPLLSVCQPLMLPYSNISFVRKLNKHLVISKVRKALAALEMERPYCVTTVPNACDVIGKFGEKKKIYYCVDDFTLWPGLDHSLVLEMEDTLIQKSDMFIATSKKLYDHLKDTGKKTTILTHGVDVGFFSNLPNKEHSLLKNIPNPRVGYYGLFDERSDQTLLVEIAKKAPHVSFVITGNVETDISNLTNITNIYFTGKVKYNELPSIVSGWDICMLPYVTNELTASINPLKLKEYIATGRPIICTPLPEALKLNQFMTVAQTTTQWIEAIQNILSHTPPNHETEISHFSNEESWAKKAQKFNDFCLKE